jgi:nucleotide-binding universal stress UspA family protein
VTTIVVGVDGSDEAHRALRFAVDEAKLRAAPLRVICTWELPVQNWGEFPPPESLHEPRRRAEELLRESAQIVERLVPDVDGHGVAETLLGHVADALLGSVSGRAVRDAPCPVVVVPHASSSK